MPSSTMPRPGNVSDALVEVSPFRVPSGYLTRSQSGIVKTRGTTAAGRTWKEEYGPLNIFRPDTHEFISWIRWAWSGGEVFYVDHPSAPGSGTGINGSSTDSPQVSGASQTGSSLNTDGWTPSTDGLLLPGDFIKIAGFERVFEVTDSVDSNVSGEAVVNIRPPIYVGASPDDNANITISGNLIRATFIGEPNVPRDRNSFWWSGLTLHFIEVP